MGNCFKSMPDEIKSEIKADNNQCPSTCPSTCCLNDRFYCCLIIKQSNIQAEDVLNDNNVINQPKHEK